MDGLAVAAEPLAGSDAISRARKPVGGFCFISVVQLCMAWWAYRQRLIRLVDLRTWFACHEVVARRCCMEKGRRPEYRLDEVHGLIGGVGGEHIRHSLARLQKAGLLELGLGAISFPASPDGMPVEDLAGFWAMVNDIPNHGRRVPVPRRTLRFLAGGARRVVIATVLGHLLRCLYYRQGGCSAEGCCKASWIASVFGVDVRNVKAARRYLGQIGWLVQLHSDHWHRQRWGGKVAVNLAWCESRDDESAAAVAGEDGFEAELSVPAESETPPPTHQITTESPPPDSHGELPSGSQNQKPAGRGPAGVLQTKEAPKKPCIRDVQPRDLQDTGRLLILFHQAADAGWIAGSQADQLRFVTAAEHALAVGNTNPCGLFVHLVRKGLWHFATQADEDAANLRVKRHLYGDFRPKDRDNVRIERPTLPSVVLSEDARLARAAMVVHAKQGGRGDAFHILRGSYRDWTRERWEKAVGELENARLQRIQAGWARRDGESDPT